MRLWLRASPSTSSYRWMTSRKVGYFLCVVGFLWGITLMNVTLVNYSARENQQQLKVSLCGVLPLIESYADSYCDSYSDIMQKGSTGTDSNGHSDAKLLWKLLNKPSYWYRYQCHIGCSTHLHWNRNWNRFSGNSSAHYYISHLNQNRNRCRNRSWAVEILMVNLTTKYRSKVIENWYFVAAKVPFKLLQAKLNSKRHSTYNLKQHFERQKAIPIP